MKWLEHEEGLAAWRWCRLRLTGFGGAGEWLSIEPRVREVGSWEQKMEGSGAVACPRGKGVGSSVQWIRDFVHDGADLAKGLGV